jgi:hypothetical protein
MTGAKVNVAGACAYLGGICRRSFYDHVRPYVPGIALGTRIVFDVEDLEAFTQRQKELRVPAQAPLVPIEFNPKKGPPVAAQAPPTHVEFRPKKRKAKPAQAPAGRIEPQLEKALAALAKRLDRLKRK